ncbi:MAG: hypothetical protein VX835_03460 [Pseudomonadota bacterium]|nr:hypothetical protein [Pseudomonadota bacterium]
MIRSSSDARKLITEKTRFYRYYLFYLNKLRKRRIYTDRDISKFQDNADGFFIFFNLCTIINHLEYFYETEKSEASTNNIIAILGITACVFYPIIGSTMTELFGLIGFISAQKIILKPYKCSTNIFNPDKKWPCFYMNAFLFNCCCIASMYLNTPPVLTINLIFSLAPNFAQYYHEHIITMYISRQKHLNSNAINIVEDIIKINDYAFFSVNKEDIRVEYMSTCKIKTSEDSHQNKLMLI